MSRLQTSITPARPLNTSATWAFRFHRPHAVETMCLYVQPICNACSAIAFEKNVELYECIFRDCKYVEECTRLLTRYELFNWSCKTPECGLNWKNIDNKLDEIGQILRMEVSLPVRPAEGNDLESHENNRAASGVEELHSGLASASSPEPRACLLPRSPSRRILSRREGLSKALEADNYHDTNIGGGKAPLRGFDPDGTSHPQKSRGAMNEVPAETTPTTTSLSVTVPAAMVSIPPRPLSASTPECTSHDRVSPNNSVTTNDNVATSENSAAEEEATASETVATNNNLATNGNVAEDSSLRLEFDPDSVDLDTFPRCRSCFIGRRRCNGQTPCDKCQQRRCFRSCRPVTVDDLRAYPARAERILNLDGGG